MGALDSKIVIVTGAAGGIGRAVTRLFASEGASLVLVDACVEPDGSAGDTARLRDLLADVERTGAKAVSSELRADTEGGAREIVALAESTFGRVDVLVNAAGIRIDKTLSKLTDADWRMVLDSQLGSAYQMMHHAITAMLRHGDGGRIVNVLGAAGFLGNREQANFAAASAGVFALTRTAAIEYQRQRIFVNALAPVAKTRLTASLPMFEHVDTLTPEHVAPAALFLASDLSGEKTGVVLGVSGAQLYSFKLTQTTGRFKDGGQAWSASEIAEHWDSIVK